jgi:hypothetical protein
MILYSPDNSALMEVQSIERDGGELVIKGKVFGTMPITARLTPAEARKGLKLLGPRLALFVLGMLFRRAKGEQPK